MDYQLNPHDDIKIDEYNLQREWVRQSTIFAKYSEMLAGAKAELDSIENQIDIERAELYIEILQNPNNFGLSKTTEGAIAAAITKHPKIEALIKARNRARHKVDCISAYVKALNQKCSALENLVRLFLAGFYSEPKANAKDKISDAVKNEIRRRGQRKQL